MHGLYHLTAAIISLLSLLMTCQESYAHDARPLFIEITQQDSVAYRTSLAVPYSIEYSNIPEIIWPDSCGIFKHNNSYNDSSIRVSGIIRCPEGLDGFTIRFSYPHYNPSLSTVIRYTPVEGQPRTAVLSPDISVWTIPDRQSWWSVAREYLKLGFIHILGGIDHLLFVTGLLILAREFRRVIIVITGFTIAHSISLSLSALQLINIPLVPVEAAITLSILFLAGEIVRNREYSLAWRYPLTVSSIFGLLHGLGFAAALKTIGLPRDEITSALLCFNIGVELGQIAFILCLAGCFRLIVTLKRSASSVITWNMLRVTAGYVMGIPASYWLFLRLAQF